MNDEERGRLPFPIIVFKGGSNTWIWKEWMTHGLSKNYTAEVEGEQRGGGGD